MFNLSSTLTNNCSWKNNKQRKKIYENQKPKIYQLFKKLAKRRASPGYARDRGFGSSGFLDFFWHISFV